MIARRDQFFINFTEVDVETIPGLVREKMVQNLERLEAAYAREVQFNFSCVTTQVDTNEETVSSELPSAAHSA